MAIQFTDFSRAPLLDSPAKTLFEDVLKGYQMSQEPKRMQQEQSARELANQFRKLDVEHKPKEYALNDQYKNLTNALQSKALQHYDEKFGLEKDIKNAQLNNLLQGGGKGKLTGDILNYKLTHPDATDDEVRNFADRLLESKINRANSSIERTNVLNATQEQRNQTQQGKLLNEAKDVQDGFVPGTGRSEKFDNPEIQKFYQNQYDLKLLRERSDSVTRNRSIYAGLVDNTFDNINVDKLVQYSGIEGEINKRLAQGQVVPEEEQKKYRNYKEEVAKVQVLAKQIRQFYGDSISPGNLAKLEQISNPATWSESPAAAKAQFEAFKKIVKQETGIFKSALSSMKPFENENTSTKGGKEGKLESSGTFDFSSYPVAGGR